MGRVKGHTDTYTFYTAVEFPGMESIHFYFKDHHKRAVDKLHQLRREDEKRKLHKLH